MKAFLNAFILFKNISHNYRIWWHPKLPLRFYMEKLISLWTILMRIYAAEGTGNRCAII